MGNKLREAYIRVFASVDGKLVLKDILNKSGVTRHLRVRTPEGALQENAVREFVFSTILQQLRADDEFIRASILAQTPSGKAALAPEAEVEKFLEDQLPVVE